MRLILQRLYHAWQFQRTSQLADFESLDLFGAWIPKSEQQCDRCLGLGGAAVEGVPRERFVVRALFILAQPLVLGSHLGDARHLLLLVHRRVLL